MPITNIVDHRSNPLNVEIDAVFEPSIHDNSCVGSTKFPTTDYEHPEYFTVLWEYNTTIGLAIALMADKNIPVTLLAYDKGSKPCD